MTAFPRVPGHSTLYDAIVRELDRRARRAVQHSDTRHDVIEAAVTVIRMHGLMPAIPAEPREEELPVTGDFPYRQDPHRYCGSNSERQSVGDPGHCEACCSVGHIVAHPEFGCSDVGCSLDHPDEPDVEPYVSSLARGPVARTLLGWTVPDHIMTFEVAPGEHTLWCDEHQPRVGSGRVVTAWAVGCFLRAHAHCQVVESREAAVAKIPPHLAAMANENGDVRFTCPRCDWFAQVPVDAKGVFLHALSDARMGHAAIAHPDLWEMWRVNDPVPLVLPATQTAEQTPVSRELLGRCVRDVWVKWAGEQENPKPSWIVAWDELDDGQREVDMRIGEVLFDIGSAAANPTRSFEPTVGLPVEETNKQRTVYFPGDIVPAGIRVVDRDRWIHGDVRQAWRLHHVAGGAAVEVVEPSPEEWQSAVDQAINERAGLCDGCDRTDAIVGASKDGRGQFCPRCLPVADGLVEARDLSGDTSETARR